MSENARRENRIQGIVDRVSSEDDFDSIKWITQAPVQTFCRSAVDETAQKNAELQRDLGIQAKIVRTMTGKENCKWCEGLAGEYEYPDVPDDVYHRHDDCDCIVEYLPGDGTAQDVWPKEWREPQTSVNLRKVTNTQDLKPKIKGKELETKIAKEWAEHKTEMEKQSAEQLAEWREEFYGIQKNTEISTIFDNAESFEDLEKIIPLTDKAKNLNFSYVKETLQRINRLMQEGKLSEHEALQKLFNTWTR